ncbi:peritrophin-1-like [Anopheles stephensi]|uniref:peritrophin-1-like n=1 Tax=Anopheles stephensi TaxID=30069 RepID=UPI0007D54C29|nr:peritrophin-1-like [Anopheles stephensi]
MKASGALVGLLLVGLVLADDRCPPIDDPESPPVLLPHPTDCEKFLICSHGNAVVSKCPPGLHWNDGKKLCDYPSLAQCLVGEAGSTSQPLQPSENCPAEYDPDHMVYTPHETDCTKYYICDPHGVELEQRCPSGLHWNPAVNYCDFPELAGCEE